MNRSYSEEKAALLTSKNINNSKHEFILKCFDYFLNLTLAICFLIACYLMFLKITISNIENYNDIIANHKKESEQGIKVNCIKETLSKEERKELYLEKLNKMGVK